MSQSKNRRLRSSRDAIISEALEDIGELMGRLEALNRTTAPLLAGMQKTHADMMSVIEGHANKQKTEFHAFTDQERMAMKESIQASVTTAAGHLEKAGKKMAQELGRPAGLPKRTQLSIALAIAVAASLMSICGAYWMFGHELSAQAVVGRATLEVWGDLDEKTKAKIAREL